MRRGVRSTSGLTLIEILFAMIILAMGIIGMASMFPLAYVNVDSGGKQTGATALAQSFLEELRTIGANDFAGMADDFPTGFHGMNTTACGANAICTAWRDNLDLANGGQLEQGAGTVTITCQDGSGAAAACVPAGTDWLATLAVTVSWVEDRGPRTVTLVTRVTL